MNVHFIFGVVATIIAILVLWRLYRWYKKVGRRCTRVGCGRTDVKRIHKIQFAPDEAVCFHTSEGKWRWWVRRLIKLTFTECKCGWVELVKTDTDPMSMWHALWVKRFHPEQYYLTEQRLIEAYQRKLRKLYLGGKHLLGHNSQTTDTPRFRLPEFPKPEF